MTPMLLTLGSSLDGVFSNFDYSIFQILGNIQNDVLTAAAKIFTSFGSTLFVAMFAVMGLVLCFFKRTRKVGLAIVIAVIIGTLITNIVVKPLVLRIRPYNTLQNDAAYWGWYVGAGMLSESDYCFPSGHTTGATEIALVLLLCHATSKRKSAKAICWTFPCLAVLVGISRVYLMVHYATDVLAGYIVGCIAGAAGFIIASLICRKMQKAPENEALFKSNIRLGGIIMMILAVLVMFFASYTQLRSSGGADAVRCAYDGDYNCQNEAQVDSSKYPPIDGKYYCKIHWKELNGQ